MTLMHYLDLVLLESDVRIVWPQDALELLAKGRLSECHGTHHLKRRRRLQDSLAAADIVVVDSFAVRLRLTDALQFRLDTTQGSTPPRVR